MILIILDYLSLQVLDLSVDLSHWILQLRIALKKFKVHFFHPEYLLNVHFVYLFVMINLE